MIWWKLSSCPRCNGDMLIEKELYYGWYEQCIMCGYTYELKDTAKPQHQWATEESKKVHISK